MINDPREIKRERVLLVDGTEVWQHMCFTTYNKKKEGN